MARVADDGQPRWMQNLENRESKVEAATQEVKTMVAVSQAAPGFPLE